MARKGYIIVHENSNATSESLLPKWPVITDVAEGLKIWGEDSNTRSLDEKDLDFNS